MWNILIEHIKNIDQSIKKIVKNGSYFCLFIFCIASALLFTYESFYSSPDLYYIGLTIFRMGSIFLVAFLACGFAFNEIKQEIG